MESGVSAREYDAPWVTVRSIVSALAATPVPVPVTMAE